MLAIVLVLLAASVALRIQAAVWEFRVTSLLGAIRTLRLDETTRTELLGRIPGLRPVPCSWREFGDEECVSAGVSIWPKSANDFFSELLWPTYSDSCFKKALQSEFTYFLLQHLGFRAGICDAEVRVRQGRVSGAGYRLAIAGASDFFNCITISVVSVHRAPSSDVLSPVLDESPEFGIDESDAYRGRQLRVGFTPAAPPDLVRHAFDVHLNCVWQLRGCRAVEEILPETWDDKQVLRRLPLARLQSDDPCPNRILTRRARDVQNILLLEVRTVTPYEGQVVADYRLTRVLKGAADRVPLRMHHQCRMGTHVGEAIIPNPAIPLLRPGARVLMFWENDRLVNWELTPCEVVAATPEALRAVEKALAALGL